MTKSEAIAVLVSLNALPEGKSEKQARRLPAAKLQALVEAAQAAQDPKRAYTARQDLAAILRGFMKDAVKGQVVIPVSQLAEAGISPSGQKYPAYWSSKNNTGAKAAIRAKVEAKFSASKQQLVLTAISNR